MPAHRAHCHTRTASKSHAATVMTKATGPGRRTCDRSSRESRRRDNQANTPATSTTVASSQAHPPTNREKARGAINQPSPATVAMSAARKATVEAVAASRPTGVRRVTLRIRSGSPRRNGNKWLAPKARWMPANACPRGSPGKTRRQAKARKTKARPKAAQATTTPTGSPIALSQARRSASTSTAAITAAAATTKASSPTARAVHHRAPNPRPASERSIPISLSG